MKLWWTRRVTFKGISDRKKQFFRGGQQKNFIFLGLKKKAWPANFNDPQGAADNDKTIAYL